jgi:hypothetical protein
MFSGEVPVKIGTFLYSFIGLLKNVLNAFLLWHVDQLLGSDREIGDCTEAVLWGFEDKFPEFVPETNTQPRSPQERRPFQEYVN